MKNKSINLADVINLIHLNGWFKIKEKYFNNYMTEI